MKKFINYVGLIALCIATTFTFLDPSSSKAMQLPNYSNEIYSTDLEFDRNKINNGLFNTYDYNALDNIEVQFNLYAQDIETNQTPTSFIGFSKCTWNNQITANSDMYYMTANLLMAYDDEIEEQVLYGTSISTPKLITSPLCQTSTRNTYLTETSYYKYAFIGTEQALKNIKTYIQNHLISTPWSTNTNSMSDNLMRNIKGYGVTPIYSYYTNSISTNITGVATSSQTYKCNYTSNTINANYYIFGELVGNDSNTYDIYYSNNKCLADMVYLNNKTVTLDFKNLSVDKKKEFFNKLVNFDFYNDYSFFKVDINYTNENGKVETFTGNTNTIFINFNFKYDLNYTFNVIYETATSSSNVIKYSDNMNTFSSIYYDNNNVYNVNFLLNNYVEDTTLGSSQLYHAAEFNENIDSTFNYIGKKLIFTDVNVNTPLNFYFSFNYLFLTETELIQTQGKVSYEKCKPWDLICFLENGIKRLVFEIPVLENIYLFVDFSISTITETINFLGEYKEVALVGNAVMLAIGLHFIKRMVL